MLEEEIQTREWGEQQQEGQPSSAHRQLQVYKAAASAWHGQKQHRFLYHNSCRASTKQSQPWVCWERFLKKTQNGLGWTLMTISSEKIILKKKKQPHKNPNKKPNKNPQNQQKKTTEQPTQKKKKKAKLKNNRRQKNPTNKKTNKKKSHFSPAG